MTNLEKNNPEGSDTVVSHPQGYFFSKFWVLAKGYILTTYNPNGTIYSRIGCICQI